MSAMITTILSLGTNLGDKIQNIHKMTGMLEKVLQSPITYSPLMETEPVGVPEEQEWYLNLITRGRYNGSPQSLLEICKDIERALGRYQKGNVQPRTADIDILLINEYVINEKDFIVPHPQILKRRFCIAGIASVAPEWIHPVIKEPFEELNKNISADIRKQKIHFI